MNGQQLKNSILQMAVQGKLVPQDPNDEPASVLLEKIRKEKKKLIKEGKIKKEKNPSYIFRGSDNLPYEKVGNNEPVCIANEVPFEIPDSWEWVRLKELCQLLDGEKRNNISYAVMDAKCLRGKSQPSFINAGKFVTAGELMILVDGENSGEVFTAPIDGYMGSTFKQLWIAPNLCTDYVLLFIDLYRIPLKNRKTGAAIPHLNKNLFLNLLLPVPPFVEQKRITKQYRILNPLVEKYSYVEKEIEYLNIHFPDLLKKSILQEAIQGKLVPQDPNDEPASKLLERIRAEKQRLIEEGKIKKDKHESIIFRRDNSYYEKLDGVERCIDDELPFEIPENWCWVRFGTALVNRDAERIPLSVAQREKLQKKYDYYGASGVIDKVDQYLFDKPLLLIGEDGANLLLRSKPIAFIASGQYWVNNHAHVIDSVGGVDLRFIALFINAINLAPYVTGTAQPKMNQEKLNSILVPLPPVAEQHRIVIAFEEIVAIIR